MFISECGIRLIAVCTEAYFFSVLWVSSYSYPVGAPRMSSVDAIVPVSYSDF